MLPSRLRNLQPYTVGAVLKLKIPKKIIAIVDFEVIRGRKKAGRVTLEGLTSTLIDSGHFTVVEIKTKDNYGRTSIKPKWSYKRNPYEK